jgi:signal transduction histidine kinase
MYFEVGSAYNHKDISLLTSLFFLLSSAFNVPAVEITEHFTSVPLSYQVQVLQTDQDISFQEAFSAAEQGLFSTPSAGLVFHGGPHYYWAQFNIRNQTSVTKSIFIEVRNAHLNHLEVFEYTEDGFDYASLGKTGDYLNFDSRPIDYRFFAFETKLMPGEMRSFLLHTDKFNESIKFPIAIHTSKGFFSILSNESTLLGGYFGIYSLVVLLLLIIVLSKPSLLNISLLFYVLGFSLLAYTNSGMGFQHSWPNIAIFNSLSRSIFASIASVSLMFFAYASLDLDKKNRSTISTFHRVFTLYIFLNALLFIGYYFLVWSQSLYIRHINVLVLQLPMAAQFFYLMLLSIYLTMTQRKTNHLLFLLAISGVGVASLVFFFEQIGEPIIDFAQEQIMLGALVFDFAILSSLVGIEFYQIRTRNISLADSLNTALVEGAENFLEGQHIERSRLAQQVHDGAGVKLSALQMQLSVLATQDKQQQQKLIQTVSTIAEDIRNYAHNLSPIILEKYGFIDAIEEVVDSLNIQQKALEIIFEHDQSSVHKKNVERELYFICLELINNALKHSEGTGVRVQFTTTSTEWCLQVEDNGRGYDAMMGKNSGIGLQGIHWRLKLLNSQMLTYYKQGLQIHQIKIPYFSDTKA